MKNRISGLVITVIMMAGSTCAQTADQRAPDPKKVTIGVSIGLNYANLDAKHSAFPTFGPNDVAKLGSIAGGVIEYRFHDNLSAQSGILYVSAGAKTDEFIGTDDFGNELGKFRFVQDLRFLEFPLLLSYKIPVSRFKLSLSAGPNIGILLSAKQEFQADYETTFQSKIDIKDKLKPVNLMIGLGAGAIFPLGSAIDLRVEVKYGRGLVNQIEEENAGYQESRDIRLISNISHAL